MSSNSSASSSVSSSAGSSMASQESALKQEPVAEDVVAGVAATNLHPALNAPTQQQQRDAAPGDGAVDDYEHGFWDNVFDENSSAHDLMDEDCGECKRDPDELMAQQAKDAMDSTSTSALLDDQWGQYDDPLTDFASSSMAFMNNPSSASTPGSGIMYYPSSSHLPSLFDDHQSILDHQLLGSLPTPRPPNASYVVQFPRHHDGNPLTLSKPIVREDGVLLVGTESVAASPNEPNRIFVTNFKTYTAGQPIAFITVENEVRDLHWINAATAIVAVGSDIQLIDVSNGSCHVRAPIKRIHSDSIRELAVSSSTHILSGGFDETVVLTDLRVSDGLSNFVSKFDAHDVVSSLRWSPASSQFSWTTDGGDFQVGDVRTRAGQLQVPLTAHTRVDTMGGLFTHEYLTAHTIVLGFEKGHTAYIDTRMPRANSCYSVTESPLAATGEIRRSKTNKYAIFGLGGYLTADLDGNGRGLEHVERNHFNHADRVSGYKTSGDFSFESGGILAVSDNSGQVSVYTTIDANMSARPPLSTAAGWTTRTV